MADYASKTYWDRRYEDGSIEHEWYFSYELLEPIIKDCRVWEPTDSVLEVGCGDKPMIQGFAGLGIIEKGLVAIDYSSTVVSQLKDQQKSGKVPSGITFLDMDACNMQFSGKLFQFICDKGTMDAVLSDKLRGKGVRSARKLLEEIVKHLAPGGTILLVSHIEVDTDEFEVLSDEILFPAFSTRKDVHWNIEAHVVEVPSYCQPCTASSNGANKDSRKRKRGQDVEEENEDDENDSTPSFGTVYLIKTVPRKLTRHANSHGEVSFQVKTYEM